MAQISTKSTHKVKQKQRKSIITHTAKGGGLCLFFFFSHCINLFFDLTKKLKAVY